MMKYVLDTNVLSEIVKRHPSDRVIDWIHDHADESYLTSVSVKELYYGLFIMPDGRRKETLCDAIHAIVEDCNGVTLPFDAFCGYICAEMHAKARTMGKGATIEDLIIAAICRRNDATLVTRNVKDFDYLGIPVCNPFDYESPILKRLKQRESRRQDLGD